MHFSESRNTRAIKTIGGAGILASFLFVPLIFERYFAMAVLLPSTRHLLWCLFATIFSLSALIALRPHKIPQMFALLLLSSILLLAVEFSFRIYINIAEPQAREEIAHYAAGTYTENLAYAGHPFLQFTGRPGAALKGNKALGNLPPFNNLGFIGQNFKFEKADHLIRVAAIGESTTADGYPAIMETFLNTNNPSGAYSFEVLNFGMGWYTTAHAVSNFFLNVIDFSPDYVILHHNWNEVKALSLRTGFRNDYAHVLDYFHEPVIYDKYIVRASALYCFVKLSLFPRPDWWFLDNALLKKNAWSDISAPVVERNSYPFERNLRTIIDFSLLKGFRIVLTTQPHATNPGILHASTMPHIIQFNHILRRIARSYGDKIIFVDLDREMTGKTEAVFYDLGHMEQAGIDFKAKMIGEVVLSDFKKYLADQVEAPE